MTRVLRDIDITAFCVTPRGKKDEVPDPDPEMHKEYKKGS